MSNEPNIDEKSRISDDVLAKVRKDLQEGIVKGHKVIIEETTTTGHQIPSLETIFQNETYGKEADFQFLVKSLYDFLHTPVLEDNFESNDEQRKPWEAAVTEQYGEAGEAVIFANRMRKNKLQDVASPLSVLPVIIGESNSEKAQLLQEISDALGDIGPYYKKLPNEEKRKIVAQFTMGALLALEILAGKPVDEEKMQFVKEGYKK